MEADLNGRKIDLRKALPLLTKDMRALSRSGISVQRTLEEKDEEGMFQMALYILRKADPTVTEAELEALTLEAYGGLWTQIHSAGAAIREVERPFGSTSTSSGASSVGTSET